MIPDLILSTTQKNEKEAEKKEKKHECPAKKFAAHLW
jgi:hypothetical protein